MTKENTVQRKGDLLTNYRIDGGSESEYATTIEDANAIFDRIVEDYGEPVTIWEITEEWDGEDWEMIEENVIRTTEELFN
jgi:hypothetical protein